jgi:hypothetical protein
LFKNGDITYVGIIPVIIINPNNMKKRQYQIKSFLNNLENYQHWYLISIEFENSTYFKKLNAINNFYVKLSNSKANLMGLTSNRNWWKRLAPTGIYEPILTENNLVLNFIMTTEALINELEFKSRVKKICPYVSIKIGYREREELEKIKSNNYFSYQQNIELFGDAKRVLNK